MHEGDCVAKSNYNKTQAKRALRTIKAKATRLYMSRDFTNPNLISSKDWMAIERICDKYLKKMK